MRPALASLETNITGLSTECWFAWGVWHALCHVVAQQPAIVTHGLDGKHSDGSLHYTGDALDFRCCHLSSEDRIEVVRHARAVLEPMGFDVLSKETPGHLDHDHVEFDTKPGERLYDVLE